MVNNFPLQVRLSDEERRRLTAAAEEDDRTVPGEVRYALREFLERRARSRKAAERDAQPPVPGALTRKQLRALGSVANKPGQWPRGVPLPPPLPTDLTDEERAMLGLAIEEEEEEAEAAARAREQPSREELGDPGDLGDDLGDDPDDTDAPQPPLSKADRERLEVIEMLTGKREYVPPGLRAE